MPYTVLLPNGNTMQFYIREVANIYATMHKGTVVIDAPVKLKLVA
jgi:hypothetical protein